MTGKATLLMQAGLVLALLATGWYGVTEVRRWRAPATRDLLNAKQQRIRAWGFFFLLLSLALWLGGTFLPTPIAHSHTHVARQIAVRFVAYWTVTVLAAVPLLPLALLDSRENLRRLADERRRLLRETLSVPAPPECGEDGP